MLDDLGGVFVGEGYYQGTELGHLADVEMEITNRLESNDGVIQGLIVARYENDAYTFYIYIDEDFRSSVEFVNVLYGEDLMVPDAFTSREFAPSEIVPGVYRDKVEGAASDLALVVGQMTRDDMVCFSAFDCPTPMSLR